MSNWADDGAFPSPIVVQNADGTKTITEYKKSDDGKTVKVTRTIRLVKHKEKVSHAAAERKVVKWQKFGAAAGHNMGPDTETTRIDTVIHFKLVRDPKLLDTDEPKQEQAMKDKLKDSNIKCRYCGGPHWSSRCPSKDIMSSIRDVLGGPGGDSAAEDGAAGPSTAGDAAGGRYVPPSLRNRGAASEGVTMDSRRRTDDTFAIRISNLSEDTVEEDIELLARPFGPIARYFLAKDGDVCRGFAFVNYYSQEHAEKAIAKLDGHGFANLILRVEFARRRD
ncbi:translation initiation factor eIF3 subunit g [Sorochytrium milnesiophthora]